MWLWSISPHVYRKSMWMPDLSFRLCIVFFAICKRVIAKDVACFIFSIVQVTTTRTVTIRSIWNYRILLGCDAPRLSGKWLYVRFCPGRASKLYVGTRNVLNWARLWLSFSGMSLQWSDFGLVYLFIHAVIWVTVDSVNYTIYNTTYNIWTSTQYNIINNNTKFKDKLEVEFASTYIYIYVCIYINIPKI
jgi:hypothetical protein